MPRPLSIILPVYNPPEKWADIIIDKYIALKQAIGVPCYLIVVNDGSTVDISQGVTSLKNNMDSTFQYVQYNHNKGKGAALKYGLQFVKTELTMFTDVDFPYTIESMVNMYTNLIQSGGLVTGFRQQSYYTDVNLFRTMLSKGLRLLNKLILNLPTNDTQCGLKAFDAQVIPYFLKCTTDRFLIDLELLLAVHAQRITIQPVEVHLRSDVSFTRFNPTVLLAELGNIITLIFRYRIKPFFNSL